MEQRFRRRAEERARRRIALLDDHALMQRWHAIIVRVRDELADISSERQIMDIAVGVVNGNQRFLHHPGRRFMDFARNWYAIAMAVAVRRQTDNDDRSASLRVLLEELRLRPDAYTLQTLRQFLPLPSDDDVYRYVMADVCSGQHINVDVVDRDIDELIQVSNDVTRYVDQHVAHTTHQPDGAPVEGPTFGEIHDALAAFEAIYRRWDRAITGNQTTGFSADDGSAWADVFDFPWRYRRPNEGEGTQRYLVTVSPLLDDAEMAILYEGNSHEMRAQQNAAIIRTVACARNLAAGDHLTEQVLPASITIERLL